MKDNKILRHDSLNDSFVLTGISRLPECCPSRNIYNHFYLEIEIGKMEHIIKDLSCTIIHINLKNLLVNSLIGYNVNEGVSNCIDQIEKRLYCPSKKAIISALEKIDNIFNSIKRKY